MNHPNQQTRVSASLLAYLLYDETELLQALTNLVAEATPEDTWRSKYTVACIFLESSSSQ